MTAVKSELVDAPYVGEFQFILECELLQTNEIGLHTQFIGEIKDIKVEEELIKDDESIIKRLMPLIYSPDNMSYYGVGDYIAKAFSIGKEI